MNTYRIYEEFRSSLGEPAAKSLAQTLGTMLEELRDTVTKEDFRSLRTSLDGDIGRLDKALCNLAEAQARTEARVSELAEAQKDMTLALQRLTIRTDTVVGRTFELQFRDRLTAYLGRFLRRGKLVPNDQLPFAPGRPIRLSADRCPPSAHSEVPALTLSGLRWPPTPAPWTRATPHGLNHQNRQL